MFKGRGQTLINNVVKDFKNKLKLLQQGINDLQQDKKIADENIIRERQRLEKLEQGYKKQVEILDRSIKKATNVSVNLRKLLGE